MSVSRKLAVTSVLLLATTSLVVAANRLKVELDIADGVSSIDIDDNREISTNHPNHILIKREESCRRSQCVGRMSSPVSLSSLLACQR